VGGVVTLFANVFDTQMLYRFMPIYPEVGTWRGYRGYRMYLAARGSKPTLPA
jgi:hypothetical protein